MTGPFRQAPGQEPDSEVPIILPGQQAPEGDLSENELLLVEQLYGDPEIPACGVCGGPRVLGNHGPGQPSYWFCDYARESGTMDHLTASRFVQRRHADRDVMRLIAEVRRRRQEERGFAGDAPAVDPRQTSLFDLSDAGTT